MTKTTTKGIPISCYFASVDQPLHDELKKHMSALQLLGVIDSWNEYRIDTGACWRQAIYQCYESPCIILLLLSADFLAMDYLQYGRLPEVLGKQDTRHVTKACVIPILLRPIVWEEVANGYALLPENKQPVIDWPDRDHAFVAIVRSIKAVASALLMEQWQEESQSLLEKKQFKVIFPRFGRVGKFRMG
uniref:TIR domain-containing protein n=1 Tax=Thermosporothrix sp. COM3 TaxID=2490863 RepID=A0A455SEI9_9CHLR|nr:hypothetical protein KTC_09270 [Thermosporothrix sp. COM3]